MFQREIWLKMKSAIRTLLESKQKEVTELKRLQKEEELRLAMLTNQTEEN